MKKLDTLGKKLVALLLVSTLSIITLAIVLSLPFNQEDVSIKQKDALSQNIQLEDIINDVSFKLLAENYMSKTSSTSYTDLFFTESEQYTNEMTKSYIESEIRSKYINYLQDIYNLNAVLIDNQTGKMTYFNRGATITLDKKRVLEVNPNILFWYSVEFDSNGNQKVEALDDKTIYPIHTLQEVVSSINELLQQSSVSVQSTDDTAILYSPVITQGVRAPEIKNCRIIFAIDSTFIDNYDKITGILNSSSSKYDGFPISSLYVVFGFIVGLFGLCTPIKKVRETKIGKLLDEQKWEIRIVLMMLTTICIIEPAYNVEAISRYTSTMQQADFSFISLIERIMYSLVMIPLVYCGIMASAYWVKTIFVDGLHQTFAKCWSLKLLKTIQKTIQEWITSLMQLNFSRELYFKGIGLIAVNIIILVFLMGIFTPVMGAIIYSVGLGIFVFKQINVIQKNYQALLSSTKHLASGDLKTSITQDLGVFEPLKEELEYIRLGFSKAIEEEIKSQKMKTELISNVSHDLKTPLTSLISYVDLLKKEKDSKKKAEYLETVERSSLRLKHLVDDLFEVSKANSGLINLEIMDVDLTGLTRQTLFEVKPQIEKANLTFKTKFSSEKVLLPLDGHKTYRILENVISNAIKYSITGTRVYIEIKEEEETVLFTIRNVSNEEITFDPNDLVERFVRGDKSRNTEGSGLGLAIAKGFCEAQGGKLIIETDEDYFKVLIRFNKNR